VVLLPPALLRPVLVILLLFVSLLCEIWGRVFGATITSASGPTLTKGEEIDKLGEISRTTTFAVEVGERWRVKGCRLKNSLAGDAEKRGLETARI
jgi:hypothetical protein